MSVSTNGQLHFGILFEEGYTFPWDTVDKDEESNRKNYDGDYEEWWRDICGYKPLHDDLWTEDGDYGKGYTEEKFNAESRCRQAFDKKHPFPVELVNYCSDAEPMYLIAIKGYANSRGYPEVINQEDFNVSEEEIVTLIKFCTDYLQPLDEYSEFPEMKPQWYLSSYWG